MGIKKIFTAVLTILIMGGFVSCASLFGYTASQSEDVNYINGSHNALTFSIYRLCDDFINLGGDQEGLVIPKVNMLIKKGIKINYVSNLGTALDLTTYNYNDFSRIATILKKAGAMW